MISIATFDFNTLMQQAKTASFEPLPAGPYDAECISADAVTSSTGKPMIKCKFEVISGPHAKRKFFNQYVLSIENETALAMFFRQMKAFGMDENFFAAVGQQGLGPVAQTMLGKRARFELGIRQFQGEDRNEVKSTKPIPGGPAASGGLPGVGAPAGLPGLPTSAGLPGVPAAQATATPPPMVTQPTPPTAPTAPTAPAVTQPVAPATVPPPAVTPVAPVQVAATPAPVAPPVQQTPAPAQFVAPAQPEPQPTPPAEPVTVGPPAVQPPPPLPF